MVPLTGFEPVTQKWSQVENHIGEKVYSIETGAEVEVKDLGALSDKMTTVPRPTPYHKFSKTGWAEDAELMAAHEKQQQEAQAREAARERIAMATEVDPADLAVALGFREAS